MLKNVPTNHERNFNWTYTRRCIKSHWRRPESTFKSKKFWIFYYGPKVASHRCFMVHKSWESKISKTTLDTFKTFNFGTSIVYTCTCNNRIWQISSKITKLEKFKCLNLVLCFIITKKVCRTLIKKVNYCISLLNTSFHIYFYVVRMNFHSTLLGETTIFKWDYEWNTVQIALLTFVLLRSAHWKKGQQFFNDWSVKTSMERSRVWRLLTLLLAAHLTAQTAALPEVIKLGRYIYFIITQILLILYM